MPTIGKVEPYLQSTTSKWSQTDSNVNETNMCTNEIITLDIGGQIFRTRWETLRRIPGSVLSNLSEDHPSHQPDTGHYYFDRSPVFFHYILDAYRKGKTHYPHDYCHLFVSEELQFWGLSESVLDCCCFANLRAMEVSAKKMKSVARKLNTDYAARFVDLENPSHTKWRKWQLAVWYFMEDPNSSVYAKIWAVFFLMIVILQLIIQSLQTHPDFRQQNQFNASVASAITNNSKILMYYTTNNVSAITVLHQIAVVIFLLEWTIRLVVCPKKKAFLLSFFNVIDCLALLPLLVEVVIEQFAITTTNTGIPLATMTKLLFVLSVLGIFRVFRLFKFGRHFVPVKIMFMSLRASLREIVFLFVILSTGMLIFATLVYWAEFYSQTGHFDSIPTGLWWSLITMSTVGYGDMYPTSSWGYLIGSICAVVGMLVTGLPIPIIANNFTNFYNYASVHIATVKSKRFIQMKRNVHNKLAIIAMMKSPNQTPAEDDPTFTEDVQTELELNT